MLGISLLVGIALFLRGGTSSPTPLEKRSFSISRPQNADERLFDGAWALRKAYLRHGIPLPESLEKRQTPSPAQSAPSAGTTAEVAAITEQNDLEYVSPTEVGGVMMNLDFDTGSSDLWVFSDRLPEFQRKGHSFYTTNETIPSAAGAIKQVSGTEMKGYTWAIRYGDGTGASGIVFTDRVKLGSVTAPEQAVEAATQISAQFYKQHSDGLLGLGFGKTNTIKPQKQKTFFENIKDSLKQPIFTVSLKKNSTGTYDFGYIDSNKYTGPMQYVPINTTRGYWEYTATGYQIGTSPAVATNFQAIADTGTTLMLLPPQTVKDYYAQVTGAESIAREGGYVYPCSSVASLPDITMSIGTTKIHVMGAFVDRGLSSTGSEKCYGGIQNGSPNLSIWGDIFLKSVFAVFDGSEQPRIGFAHQA